MRMGTGALLLLVAPIFLSLASSPHALQLEQQHRLASSSVRPVWSFWSSSNLPDLVQLCFDTVRAHASNGTWELHVLTPDCQAQSCGIFSLGRLKRSGKASQETAMQYVNDNDLPQAFRKMQPSYQADALRLALLRRHGGLWIDATSIVTRELDGWIGERFSAGKEFVGFYIDHYTGDGMPPLVASWAIAVAHPELEVMAAWHAAYLRLWQNRSSAEGISGDSFFQDVDISHVNPLMQDYLHIELVLQALLQRDEALLGRFLEQSELMCSEETAYGLQANLGLNWMADDKCGPVTRSFASLPEAAMHAMEVTPLVKLRHQDRAWLIRMSKSALLMDSASVLGSLFKKSGLTVESLAEAHDALLDADATGEGECDSSADDAT